MSQNAPHESAPPALFDPASVKARDYEPSAVVALALWCIIGVVLMFYGNAITDTFGTGLVVAEAAVLLMIDRRGLYTDAGLFKVDQWNKAQRVLLAIGEVLFFFVTVIIYVIRIGMLTFSQLPSSQSGPGSDRRR